MSTLFTEPGRFKQYATDLARAHATWLLTGDEIAVTVVPPQPLVCDRCGSDKLILGERNARCATCTARLWVFR
jgi:hypothetical protein